MGNKEFNMIILSQNTGYHGNILKYLVIEIFKNTYFYTGIGYTYFRHIHISSTTVYRQKQGIFIIINKLP